MSVILGLGIVQPLDEFFEKYIVEDLNDLEIILPEELQAFANPDESFVFVTFKKYHEVLDLSQPYQSISFWTNEPDPSEMEIFTGFMEETPQFLSFHMIEQEDPEYIQEIQKILAESLNFPEDL